MLLEGHKKFGYNWTEIAKLVGGRTDHSVQKRFVRISKGKNNQRNLDSANTVSNDHKRARKNFSQVQKPTTIEARISRQSNKATQRKGSTRRSEYRVTHTTGMKVPVVFASVDDVRGSFAAFIEEHVDKKEEVWKCGICKIVLPEGFHIGGSAERARQRVLKQGGMKVSITYHK